MFDSYIDDVFGNRYILKKQSDLTLQKSFSALNFADEMSAHHFISRLRAPLDYWQKLVTKAGYQTSSKTRSTSSEVVRLVSQLIYRKQLYLFELDSGLQGSSSPSKRSLSKNNGDTYVFSHVSSLLISQPREVVAVTDKKAAEKLIDELSPSPEQLNQISKELNISTLESRDSSVTKDRLVEALVAGDVVINLRKPLASPPQRQTETEVSAVDKPVELSPDAGTVSIKQDAANDPMSNIDQKTQAETLVKAAEEGTPFCEECAKDKDA